jgi:hypothetical protein
MNADELIKEIFRICQNTPCLDSNKNPKSEAQRLEDTVAKINTLCDTFFGDKNQHYNA